MDWIAAFITLTSVYMIGCKGATISRNGFLVGVAGSVVWCIAVPVYSLWFINGVCSILNIRAYINKKPV